MFPAVIALLLAQPDPSAPPPPVEAVRLVLKVGQQKPSPIPTAMGVNCDNWKIVQALDLGDHLEFKGLAKGKTLCGLGRGKFPPKVVEIIVEG